MLRLATIVFTAVVIALLAVSLLPARTRTIPERLIQLGEVNLTLYPQADPEAVWSFSAKKVDYLPQSRETTLYDIADSQRVIKGEVDFTLESELLTIDSQENLRGEQMSVHLIEANWDLDMQARDERQVLIDQRRGKFEVPLLLYSGDGIQESRDENVRMNFDLTDFEAGGPSSIGYNRFIDTPAEDSGP